MNKLIVNNEKNQPIAVVGPLLHAVYGFVANIEQGFAPKQNYVLEWQIDIVHYSDAGWLALCSVALGFYARTHGRPSGSETHNEFIPVTEVYDITVSADCMASWHGFEGVVERVRTAVFTGKLGDMHYEANGFLRLGSLPAIQPPPGVALGDVAKGIATVGL